MFEPFQAQIYCDLTHYGRDLECTAELKRRVMQTASSFTERARTHPFVFPCDAIMQKYSKSQTNVTNYLCFVLHYSSLPASYEVIQHGPLSFCSHSAVFFTVPACINVSRPPHRLLIYESYPALSLLSPVGGIDVESVTWRVASCPQISWILFWQPVASSTPDLYEKPGDNILERCIKFRLVCLGVEEDFFFSYCGLRLKQQQIFLSPRRRRSDIVVNVHNNAALIQSGCLLRCSETNNGEAAGDPSSPASALPDPIPPRRCWAWAAARRCRRRRTLRLFERDGTTIWAPRDSKTTTGSCRIMPRFAIKWGVRCVFVSLLERWWSRVSSSEQYFYIYVLPHIDGGRIFTYVHAYMLK